MVKCTNPKYNRPCILTNAYASVTQTPSRSQTCPPQTFLTPPSQLSPPPLPSFPPPEVTLFWILWPEMSFACSRAPWSVSCVGFFRSSSVFWDSFMLYMGFPAGSIAKNPPAACSSGTTGYAGSIPGSGRPPGEGNDTLPQDSGLGNPMDRGGWRPTVQGVARVRHVAQHACLL